MDEMKKTPDMMSEDEKLYFMAGAAKNYSYSPYSEFKVGAALLTDDNIVYMGCNVENVSYGATICAERNAIFKAVSEGKRKFTKIAIASGSDDYTCPCGLCLQVMQEFMPEGEVIMGGKDKPIKKLKMKELLPTTFKNWK